MIFVIFIIKVSNFVIALISKQIISVLDNQFSYKLNKRPRQSDDLINPFHVYEIIVSVIDDIVVIFIIKVSNFVVAFISEQTISALDN